MIITNPTEVRSKYELTNYEKTNSLLGGIMTIENMGLVVIKNV